MVAAVELRNIRKRFGGLTALDGASMSLAAGRVHGLLGENGAGKTTLMNVLYGLLRPDGGAIHIAGNPAVIRTPGDALAAGIGMVHQHFMLAGALTVLDNVLLGDRRARQWLNRGAAARRLKELSGNLGLPIDPMTRIADLSIGQQQRVEILKALYRNVRVLILDEPTAVLAPAETDQLFAAVDRLRRRGTSIVFISHKLGEVKRICDDLTVLRRGRVVFDGAAAEVSTEELARHMVGRDVVPIRLNRSSIVVDSNLPRPMLECRDLSALPLRNVTFDLLPGEILGIAGVDGNGQQQLAEALVGLRSAAAGRIVFDGTDITPLSAAARFRSGIAHIPNDRQREGLIGSMSIVENIALKHPISSLGLMRWTRLHRIVHGLIGQFDIRAASAGAAAATLSGGNQQKVVLARELAVVPPRLVIAMNPARGLDLAATNFVHEQLLAVRHRGDAVLLIGSELDELLALCDRIAVLYDGRLTMSDFPREGSEQIGRMMTGAQIHNHTER